MVGAGFLRKFACRDSAIAVADEQAFCSIQKRLLCIASRVGYACAFANQGLTS